MNGLESTLQENFYLINAVIAVLFLVVYGFLIHALIQHMRQMVRLKYHTDKRAEFDESRVKIILASVVLLDLAYISVWAFSLLSLDISNYQDFELASGLFKAANASILVGAYFLFFINNRIKGDIKHIKETVEAEEDPTQTVLSHL